MPEVIGTVLIEPVCFLGWGATFGIVVESPGLIRSNKLLHISIAVFIYESLSFCGLDNNSIHLGEKGREVGKTRPPLIVRYVDELKHILKQSSIRKGSP